MEELYKKLDELIAERRDMALANDYAYVSGAMTGIEAEINTLRKQIRALEHGID